jgi:hypothetical protein
VEINANTSNNLQTSHIFLVIILQFIQFGNIFSEKLQENLKQKIAPRRFVSQITPKGAFLRTEQSMLLITLGRAKPWNNA